MGRFGLTLCVAVAVVVVVCAAFAPVLSVPALSAASEPLRVTACQLLSNPPAYDHKVVEVEAFVSQGFEDFTLFDPNCNVYPEIWLEYGGNVNSGTVYFGPGTDARTREEPFVVQGIPIPLVDDELFRKFDEKIHRPIVRGHSALTRATLVGTYFAGRPDPETARQTKRHEWGGFGHFGCCTLLAIQQVKAADLGEHPQMDELGAPSPLIEGFQPDANYYYNLIPDDTGRYVLEQQGKAEEGARAWAFDDSKRVAMELIAADTKGRQPDPEELIPSNAREGFVVYTMKVPEWNVEYEVLVSKPAWLSFYARDSRRVAWVALGATVTRLNKKRPMNRAR